jgi:hypothetical protein
VAPLLVFYIAFSPANFLAFGFFQCLCVENSRIIARVQLSRIAEDKSASVRITPPPAVSYQKARNHCLKVAKNLAVAITVRRAPGGQIVCWKATAQEIALREKRGAALQRRRAQETSEHVPASPRRAKRKRASTQTTLV